MAEREKVARGEIGADDEDELYREFQQVGFGLVFVVLRGARKGARWRVTSFKDFCQHGIYCLDEVWHSKNLQACDNFVIMMLRAGRFLSKGI